MISIVVVGGLRRIAGAMARGMMGEADAFFLARSVFLVASTRSSVYGVLGVASAATCRLFISAKLRAQMA